MFELVVYRVYKRINSGYRLKLDSPQDGAFEGFREGLVNFLGAGKLLKESCVLVQSWHTRPELYRLGW